MKNKAMIIIGVIMVLLAVISVVSYFASANKSDEEVLSVTESSATKAGTQTKAASAPKANVTTTTYKWEPVMEPTISEEYVIITAAGGNGAWQVTEQGSGYQQGNDPIGGEIVIE